MENSASSTNTTEILKPVKKRKRKDYQSPSEEEYESEQMVRCEKKSIHMPMPMSRVAPGPPLYALLICVALIGAFQCHVSSMLKE